MKKLVILTALMTVLLLQSFCFAIAVGDNIKVVYASSVYSSPGFSEGRVGRAEYGTVYKVLDVSNSWCKITLRSSEYGWINNVSIIITDEVQSSTQESVIEQDATSTKMESIADKLSDAYNSYIYGATKANKPAYETAIEKYNDILNNSNATSNERFRAYYWISKCYLKLGNAEKASDNYNNAIDVDPDNPALVLLSQEIDKMNGPKKIYGADGIKLGDTKEHVLSIKGKPSSSQRWGYDKFYASGFGVYLESIIFQFDRRNRVNEISICGPGHDAINGVNWSSTKDDVLAIYGEPINAKEGMFGFVFWDYPDYNLTFIFTGELVTSIEIVKGGLKVMK